MRKKPLVGKAGEQYLSAAKGGRRVYVYEYLIPAGHGNFLRIAGSLQKEEEREGVQRL